MDLSLIQYFLSINHFQFLFDICLFLNFLFLKMEFYNLCKYMIFQVMEYIEYILITISLIVGSKHEIIKNIIDMFCLSIRTTVELSVSFLSMVFETIKESFNLLKGEVSSQGVLGMVGTIATGVASLFVSSIGNGIKFFLDFMFIILKFLFDMLIKIIDIIFDNKIVLFILKYIFKPILFLIYLFVYYFLRFHIIMWFLCSYEIQPNIIEVQNISYNNFLQRKKIK